MNRRVVHFDHFFPIIHGHMARALLLRYGGRCSLGVCEEQFIATVDEYSHERRLPGTNDSAGEPRIEHACRQIRMTEGLDK